MSCSNLQESRLLSEDEIPFSEAEALRSGTFISGMPGYGKTNLAKLLVRRLLKIDVRIFVFDPSDAWVEEGPIKRIQEISKSILDIPIPKMSTVFDIKLLIDREQQEFVENFSRRLFHEHIFTKKRDRVPTICLFEEAQIYLPEGIFRAKRAAEIKRLTTLGRNFALRVFIVTQFAANVDKTPVKACGQKYLGYTDEPNDWHYLSGWVKAKRKSEKGDMLASLEIGEFFYRFKRNFARILTPEFKSEVRPEVVTLTGPKSLQGLDVQNRRKEEKIKVALTGLVVGFLWGVTLLCVIYLIWVFS